TTPWRRWCATSSRTARWSTRPRSALTASPTRRRSSHDPGGEPTVIRVAAAGDLHFGPDSAGTLRPHVERIDERADVLLLAGDLTKVGLPEEAEVLAAELRDAPVPVVAVLGNHDHHSDQPGAVRAVLEDAGVLML